MFARFGGLAQLLGVKISKRQVRATVVCGNFDNARAMGEFGAVSVVSGHITGKTDTMPLRVEKLYNEYDAPAAFAVASLLALLALLTLGVKTCLEWKQARQFERAQFPREAQNGGKDFWTAEVAAGDGRKA